LPPGRRPAWPDRWLHRRAGRVVAFGAAEAEGYVAAGVPRDRVAVVAPGVPLPPEEATTRGANPLGLAGRVLLAVGPMEAHKGFRDAIWALDILLYLYDDLHLILAGGGAERPRVMEFARGLQVRRRVRFPGPVPDLAPLFRCADVVWALGRTGGGVGAALEATAASRPVVAARLPGLAEVVADGGTGLLYRPGDKADLARQTRALLDDPGRARALGAAGRRRAAEHFTVEALVRRCAAVYKDAAKSAMAP
jgi:glycosyltransferase involved in cell wall biosynthesis